MKNKLKFYLVILAIMIGSVILHNLIYAIFKIEEPVFFTLFLISFVTLFAKAIFDFFRNILNNLKKLKGNRDN